MDFVSTDLRRRGQKDGQDGTAPMWGGQVTSGRGPRDSSLDRAGKTGWGWLAGDKGRGQLGGSAGSRQEGLAVPRRSPGSPWKVIVRSQRHAARSVLCEGSSVLLGSRGGFLGGLD